VACSPWFGEDDDALISKIESRLKEGPPKSKLLYVAHEPIGREGIEERIVKLVDVLKRNEHEDFEWDYKRALLPSPCLSCTGRRPAPS
jgi:hypothetical protein